MQMLCIEENPKRPFYNMYNFAQCILEPFEIFYNINHNAELRTCSKFLHLITKVSHYNFLVLIFILIPGIRMAWIISETLHYTRLFFIFALAWGLWAIRTE